MNKNFFAAMSAAFFLVNAASAACADTQLPKKKQTELGLYLTAQEAFAQWHADRQKTKILDVRTPAEYVFVGHAPTAINIPVKFFRDEINREKMKPAMIMNEKFVGDVKKKYNTTDTILVMCRSGGRAAIAVNLLAKAGFKNVYNIIDGFEGDSLANPASYHNGKRIINGWKNSGAPWTYTLDPDLVYYP